MFGKPIEYACILDLEDSCWNMLEPRPPIHNETFFADQWGSLEVKHFFPISGDHSK